MQTSTLELKHFVAINLAVSLRRWFGAGQANGIGVLTYHRVTPLIAGAAAPTWNVTPDRFREQLAGLLEQGFQPWSLSRAVQTIREDREIPRNVFCVTFDDGYRNNYFSALPVLRELNIPATVFLATGWLGSESAFAYDDWQEAGTYRVPPESWKSLTIDQCHRMLDSGLIEFGAHTHSHNDFRGDPQAFTEDLQTSVDFLADRFGIRSPAFAFPFGAVSSDLLNAARTVDISSALTTRQRLNSAGDDPFNLGRFGGTQMDTATTLAAKLEGWYSRARQVWQWIRHPVQQISAPV